MAGDKGVEIAAPHIDFAPELAESYASLVAILLELTTTDAKLFTHLLAREVLICALAPDIYLGQLLAHAVNKV